MQIQEQNFGLEVEMTGITRKRAAEAVAEYFRSNAVSIGGIYDGYNISDDEERTWKIVRDSSILTQTKINGRVRTAGSEYSVEFVTPICRYEDIEKIQEIIRKLREAGGFCNNECGVHVHVNAALFKAYQLRNLVNIVAAKEDMVFKALKVDESREARYCKKIDQDFLKKINSKKPKTIEEFRNMWYDGEDGSNMHYHQSRYHCLNLHSVFQKGSIEFRAFNGSLHAGKLKAYLQFCMAIAAQAYNQKSASPIKTVSENEKYTFRVWLLRLGLIGDEFKTARKHLLDNLEGCIAWKDPLQAERQKERIRQKKESVYQEQPNQEQSERENHEQIAAEEEQTFAVSMSMSM